MADVAEGELGLAERLVVDVEGVGLAGLGGSDSERADPDAGWIFVELDCRAGQADGIGVGYWVLASLAHQLRKRPRKRSVMGTPLAQMRGKGFSCMIAGPGRDAGCWNT